jgi:hypothetical protein
VSLAAPTDAIARLTKEVTADARLVQVVEGFISASEGETVADVQMVRGDTRPYLDFVVRKEDGTVADLTGSTQVFRIRRLHETTVRIARSCVIQDAPNGRTRFMWQATDWDSGKLDAPGVYEGELEITWADGTVSTVVDLIKIIVREQVG